MNGWRQEAKRTIRAYPALRERKSELHAQSIVPKYSAAGGGGGGESRPVEMAALRELPPADARRLRAVELAIETTGRHEDSELRLKAMGLLYWLNDPRSIAEAAEACNVHEQTAKKWNMDFVELVDAYLRVLLP